MAEENKETEKECDICSVCEGRGWLVVEVEAEDGVTPPLREKIKCRCDKAVTIPIVNNRIFECSKCGGKYELLAGELGCCTADDENSTSGMCGGELIEKV